MKATQKGASRTTKERLGQPLHEGNPKGASRPRARALRIKGKHAQEAHHV